MPNIIYHYCSVNAFDLIITNKCIRTSDLNKTNDYMEKKWSYNMFLRIIQDELKQIGVKLNLDEKHSYYKGIDSHRSFIEEAINNFVNMSYPILITCFSKEKDKLSQWRSYGQDGCGVAIGFDLNKIKLLQNEKYNIKVKDVIYEEEEQIHQISKVIWQSVKYMKESFNKDSIGMTDDFNRYFREKFDVFCRIVIDELEQISCCIKNSAFAEEEETRIIYNPGLYKEISDYEADSYFKDVKKVNKYKVKPIRFYNKDNRLVSFSDINFSEFVSEDIVPKIVLGPKSKLREDDVYYFLFSNGYNGNNIGINRSKATYR